ncbi:hypothetical protein PC116_g28759 [Phytophthora cactorum]|uniref:Uncharacterized protein n=1 Tax=Phytophthora cactorum TaxID=29920 RepID=A0A8T1JHS3_9STRA|nr:hypothetical protein PC114_g26875 [Phytophthora cactorum]KAG2879196.1 hypothetical protein PC117_g26805 [Phytophthora cactorum]KAG2957219.1 hypothetical protein PC118_g24127 [Phytophthora cactorum]KAG2959722.1 hypothetical protein PC119_g26623 [Phytophthora cactorum]KAG4222768.1 hypothetical protein PC116_g28759 [Phytophthora cactorum]
MPLYTGNDGALYAATNSDECSSYLGRSCVANTLIDSGSFDSRNGETALKTIKGVSTFVNYKPDATETTSGSQQQQQQQQEQQPQSSQSNGSKQQSNGSQQQSSQTSGSAQQQSSQTSDSDQQQTKQTSGSEQQELQSRKLAVQTSDLEKEWQQTTGNFGVGKLD